MKTPSSIVLLALALVTSQITFTVSASPAYQVVARGPDWRVLQGSTLINGTNFIHRYVEIATGLCHTNSYGQLVDSSEQITILPTGDAAATRGRHQVFFPSDICNGVLEVVTPDGRHLKSRPLAVSLDDGSNTVFIATLTNSVGWLTASNQVTYKNCFSGIKADLVCNYRRSGFECDLVLRSQPPDASQLGLDPTFSTLQLVTEFFNTADPQEIPAQTDDWFGLQDTTLKFGKLTMKQGRAFATTNSQAAGPGVQIPVYKRWLHLDNRTFLIEELPLVYLADDLDKLPLSASAAKPAATIKLASGHSAWPAAHGLTAGTNQILLASHEFKNEPGVVLDYDEINSDTDQSDIMFAGGTTYYVSGPCWFNNVTLEGGTVIKYQNSGWNLESMTLFIEVDGTLTCDTSSDHPAIFTAVDDDTVGEQIPGSTGNPAGNFYANPAIFYAPGSLTLSHVRIGYAMQAVWVGDYSSITLSDAQLINCQVAAVLGMGDGGGSPMTLTCNNCLYNGPYYGVLAYDYGGGGDSYNLTNCTFDHLAYPVVAQPTDNPNQVNAVNCIFANCNLYVEGGLQGGHNGFYNSSYYGSDGWGYTFGSPATTTGSSPFKTAGAANYYLADDTFRGMGANLLGEIETMTTYAPQDGGWPDTNGTDLGYHYPVNEDSDHDGLPDWWELANGLNPLVNDASLDPDGDGASNLQEYLAGTDPQSGSMVIAWGDNSFGESSVPAGLTNVIAVAAGGDFGSGWWPQLLQGFSLALRSDGTLIAWGNNRYGQTNITGLTGVAKMAAGVYHGLALLTDGTVSSWGAWCDVGYPTVAVPSGLNNVIGIAAGYDHDLALRSDGSVVAWSYKTNALYVQVPANLPPAKAVSAGWDHSVALLTNGTVVVWGQYLPPDWAVPASATNVVAIAAGDFHTLALKADGTVLAWGEGDGTDSGYEMFYGDYGQSMVPAGLSNVVAIAAGGQHSMALKSDGTVVMWGDLNAPAYPLDQIAAIGSGEVHNLAIRRGHLTPIITSQPANQTVLFGTNATFSVAYLGLAKASYQWQFNGVNISGATNAVLVVANARAAQTGNYQVVISNGAGSVTSSNVALAVVLPPVITSFTQPTNQTVVYASTTTFSVAANVPGNIPGFPVSYQWQFNGTNIGQATSSNFTFVAMASGNYSVIVSDAAGSTSIVWQATMTYAGSYIAPGTVAYHLSTNAVGYATGYSANYSNMLELANWTGGIPFSGTNLALLTNAVWSTNCWLHGVQGLTATCIGYSNGLSGQFLISMVSPRHYLHANHLHGAPPDLIAFLDTNNAIYWRKNMQMVAVGNDTDVGILDADLPPSVGYLPVIPANYTNYLPTTSYSYVQGIGLHQDLSLFSQPMTFGDAVYINWNSTVSPPFGLGTNWNVTIYPGDSSNPEMFLIGNQFVLVSHNFTVGGGPNYAYQLNAINQQMHYLSTNNAVGTDFQLTQFSLTNWPTIR